MSGFIDHQVRVEIRKSGDFLEALARYIPYANVVGYTISVPSSQKALPSPKDITLTNDEKAAIYSLTPKQHKLSQAQQKVLAAIKEGHQSRDAIINALELEGPRTGSHITKVLNSLKKHKIIKGVSGNYTLRRE